MIIDYTIIRAKHDTVQYDVKRLLAKGWQPSGDPSFFHFPDGTCVATQAMVLEATSEVTNNK